MKWFLDLPIAHKTVVIIVSTTLLALVAGFSVVIVSDVRTFRGDMVDTTLLVARAVGQYSVGDLTFGTAREAEQTLRTLDTVPTVLFGCLYNEDGEVFATYSRSGDPLPTPAPRQSSAAFEGDLLHVFNEIVYQGQRYGTVYLVVSTAELDAKVRRYLATMLATACGLMLLAVLVALRFQRLISTPIRELAEVARRVSAEEDYSIRADRRSADEVGELCDGVNAMLGQIEQRQAERDLAEEALRASEEKYRTLFEQSRDVIYITTRDGRFLDFNQAALDMYGYSRKELEEVAAADLYVDPAERSRFQQEVEAHGYVRDFEVRLRRKDGSLMDCLLTSTLRRDRDGRIIGYQGIIRDVTERRRAEQELRQHREHLQALVDERTAEIVLANDRMQREITERREVERELRASEEKYRELISTSVDGVVSVDADLRVILWNSASERIFGYSEDEILGQNVLMVVPQRHWLQWKETLTDFATDGAVAVSGRTTEVTGLRKDGREVPLEISHSARRTATGWIATSIVRDISERKQTERALRQSEEDLKTMLSNLPSGTAIIDWDTHTISDVNPMATRMIGAASDEIIGRSCHLFICPAEEGQCPITDLGQAIDHSEGVLLTASGERRQVLKTVRPIVLGDRQCLMESFVDITDLKQAQARLSQMADELKRSNQELEQFAYIASHDLKEPLRGIETFSQFLIEDYQDRLDDDGKDYLKRISAGTVRMRNLIDDLLVLSRVSRTKNPYESLDSEDLVRDAIKRLRPIIEERGARVEVDDELPFVHCDPVKMKEVFYNLIANALKYNDKDQPVIRVASVNGANLQGGAGAEDGDAADRHVCFTVRDNGIGIAEQHLEAVFVIFKRLHGRDEFGGGTGAGLAIVKKIVEEHGGSIWVESEPGKGSTFFVKLPRRQEA